MACKFGTVPVSRCRLIVVGQDGAGKSCFIDSLLDRPYKSKNPSTRGIAIDTAITAAKGRGDGGPWSPCDDYLDKYIAAGYVIKKKKPLESTRIEIHEEPHLVIASAETREISDT
eukprot:m.189631 g.189631  ORF g.189631 m.189631 type:complete len:115 (+) comp39418_c0_seq2:1054-1398(+)